MRKKCSSLFFLFTIYTNMCNDCFLGKGRSVVAPVKGDLLLLHDVPGKDMQLRLLEILPSFCLLCQGQTCNSLNLTFFTRECTALIGICSCVRSQVLASDAREMSQPDHNEAIKNYFLKCLNWYRSRHHSLLWKTIEKPKIKMSTNQIQRFGSRLSVGKVLAPHNARPKTVPLIK